MKTHRILTWVMPLGCVAWLGACGGEQPDPQCTVGRGDHAVRYTLKQGTGTCANKKVDVVGAQAFRIPGAGKPPSLVFKPQPLAANEGKDPDTSHSLTGTGDFTSEYPQSRICSVPELSEARQVIVKPDTTVTDTRYTWRDIVVQGQARIPGTQWTAELTYVEDGCTAVYEAVGVFPAIKCVKSDGTRDESICGLARPGLSSLDPAFPIECETSANLCVLKGTPPVLNP